MVISQDSFVHIGTPGYGIGSDIALDGNQSYIDLSTFIGHDHFSAHDTAQLSVYLNAQTPVTLINDTGLDAHIHGEYSTGPLTYIGGSANDTIMGTPANDVFNVGSGNDTIDGAGGFNTVKYDSHLDGDDIKIVNGSWQIGDSGHGIDKLNNIQEVTDGAHNFLLVGDGGFQSLQAAIDAAQNGDTILVAPGTYTESANYNPNNNTDDPNFTNPVGLLVNKSVTIEGVDSKGRPIDDASDTQATIVSSIESDWGTNFYVTAANVTISGLNLQSTAVEYGGANTVITDTGHGGHDTVTLTGVKMSSLSTNNFKFT